MAEEFVRKEHFGEFALRMDECFLGIEKRMEQDFARAERAREQNFVHLNQRSMALNGVSLTSVRTCARCVTG